MSVRAGVRMFGWALGAIVGIAVVLFSALVAGMRWKLPPVLNAVRRMNRSLTNPRVMRSAGTAGTQTSVVRHVGRSSGSTYETPVDAIATDDGFLIALPYGTEADWVRNVLAAGAATIVSQGESIGVDSPIIAATADVAEQLPPRTLRTLRLFGVTECLHLQRSADGHG
ncbi:MAG: nitroreductase family deazaflavin-dependent oxidoreductase [Mycobacterium sp.]